MQPDTPAHSSPPSFPRRRESAPHPTHVGKSPSPQWQKDSHLCGNDGSCRSGIYTRHFLILCSIFVRHSCPTYLLSQPHKLLSQLHKSKCRVRGSATPAVFNRRSKNRVHVYITKTTKGHLKTNPQVSDGLFFFVDPPTSIAVMKSGFVLSAQDGRLNPTVFPRIRKPPVTA